MPGRSDRLRLAVSLSCAAPLEDATERRLLFSLATFRLHPTLSIWLTSLTLRRSRAVFLLVPLPDTPELEMFLLPSPPPPSPHHPCRRSASALFEYSCNLLTAVTALCSGIIKYTRRIDTWDPYENGSRAKDNAALL